MFSEFFGDFFLFLFHLFIFSLQLRSLLLFFLFKITPHLLSELTVLSFDLFNDLFDMNVRKVILMRNSKYKTKSTLLHNGFFLIRVAQL